MLGVAVLVLIALGIVHLSSTGTAVPVEDDPGAAGEPISTVESAGADGPGGAEDSADAEDPAEAGDPDGEPDAARSGNTAPAGADDVDSADSGAAGPVTVHVSGAVTEPGVIELPAGSRVDDAVEAAGGLTQEADLAAVNLARLLVDGEQIHIPEPGETPPVPAPGPGGGEDSGGAGASSDGSPAGAGQGDAPIDINTATAAQLEELPGVGPAIAERIIEHRELNGPFASVDDLQEVSGIGPATLEKMRDRATV